MEVSNKVLVVREDPKQVSGYCLCLMRLVLLTNTVTCPCTEVNRGNPEQGLVN